MTKKSRNHDDVTDDEKCSTVSSNISRSLRSFRAAWNARYWVMNLKYVFFRLLLL